MMRLGLTALVAAVMISGLTACRLERQEENGSRTISMEIIGDYSRLAPADVAILPIDAESRMDSFSRKELRQSLYDLLIKKNYAPFSLAYIDGLLKKENRLNIALSTRHAWNTEPFKGLFASDAVMMVSVEKYAESGRPSREGIEIWGKAALFDSKTMGLLYEYHIRPAFYPSSDSGKREEAVARAVRDFSRSLLARLPDYSARSSSTTLLEE